MSTPHGEPEVDQRLGAHGEPSLAAQRFDAAFPVFAQLGRTGPARYSPSVIGDKRGRVFTYSPDTITVDEYDKMRMDAQIRAGLQLLKLPIQQAPWMIACEDQDIAAYCTEILETVWPTFLRHILLSMDFGFSVFETILTTTYGLNVSQNQGRLRSVKQQTYPYAVTIDRMMQLDPKTLYLLAYRWSGEFAGVRQYLPNTQLIPAEKCFIFSNDKEFSEHHGVSRLKPCYPYWMFKQLMYEFTNIRYETWSMPGKIGRYPNGQSEIGRDGSNQPIFALNGDVMLSLLNDMRNNFSAAIPSNRYENGEAMWDITAMETGSNGQDHLQYIDHLDLQILKALLVPQLALEVGSSGSYGLAEQQLELFMMNTKATMDQISQELAGQLLNQIVKFQFGTKAPRVTHHFMPIHGPVKDGLLSMFFQTLSQGQPIPVDEDNFMIPDWSWMSKTLGVPVKMLTHEETAAIQESVSSLQPQDSMGMDPNQQDQQGQQMDPNGAGQGRPGYSDTGKPAKVSGNGETEYGQSGSPASDNPDDHNVNMSQTWYEIVGDELVLL